MRVSIHQPHYFPWIRYFNKIVMSDYFVILDDTQYEKNGWQSRTRIRSDKEMLLTVPVHHNLDSQIMDVKIAEKRWREKHIRTLYHVYSKSLYFNDYFEEIRELLMNSSYFMSEINISTIKYVMKCLDIKTPIIRSSELKTTSAKSEKIIEICKALGANTYLSGEFAINEYMDLKLFKDSGIKITSTDYICQPYRQMNHTDFIPDLCILDLLMNNSKEFCRDYINKSCIYEV